MTPTRRKGATPDLFDTRSRVSRRITEDPAFRNLLVKRDDGTDAPIIVASWSDTVADVFTGIDRVGLPASLVLPRGDDDVWLFTVSESDAHPHFVEPWHPHEPLREFIKHIWERETVAVRLESAVQLKLHLQAA